jgi:hypothetical protein
MWRLTSSARRVVALARCRREQLRCSSPTPATAGIAIRRALSNNNHFTQQTMQRNTLFVRSASIWKRSTVQSSSPTSTTAGTTNQYGAWLSATGGALLLFVWWNANDQSRVCCTAHAEAASVAAPNHQKDENDEDDDDPYANLPEHDEETDCSMCQTFRQGPCRPYWRKLERCFKDHSPKNDEESNVGTKCVRYFTPHQECLSRYINLYQLIDLHQTKQPLVDETEASMADHERQYWLNDSPAVTVDWSAWRDFGREMGPSYSQTMPRNVDLESSKLPPLWQRLPDNVEPVLIGTTCTVPMTVDTVAQQSLILKYAYAIDQDGFVIGLSYNRLYGDLLEQAKGTSPNEKDDGDSAKDKGHEAVKESNDGTAVPLDLPPTFEFSIYILPGETQTVRIVGMYFENPLHAPSDKTILDAVLYKTATAYNLLDMMQDDGSAE